MNAARGFARLVAGEPFLLNAPRPVNDNPFPATTRFGAGRSPTHHGPGPPRRRAVGSLAGGGSVIWWKSMSHSLDLIRRLEANVSRALVGKPEAVRLAVVGLLARGHILIEDVPGVGKTTLAAALARSIGAGFQRIQFTSDMLPSDVIGVSIWEPTKSEFVFKPGPLFTNIVLADEINRTTPKTQSSLLEAMNEAQVSLDHSTYPLPKPFMVLATQNPLEYEGTHALPESQLDRFLLRIRIGYPGAADEKAILRGDGAVAEALVPVLTTTEVLELQAQVDQVRVED